ncbi:MAG: GTPase Era [Peptococcaceae bacterium]|nr:GTPase Era [Peptococcaceae bacterium]
MSETGSTYKSGFVAVIGRPNVGKSTLVNNLVRHKVAITSNKPQTTRHRIRAVLTRENAQVIFVDTPGIHKPKHRLGRRMVDAALDTLNDVDLILFLMEAHREPGPGDDFILSYLEKVHTPVFLVINKIDLVAKDRLLPFIDDMTRRFNFAEVVPVSALNNDNLQRLENLIISYLPPGPQYYPADIVTDRPDRFIIAELVREKVLKLTTQEVPHSVAVVIEQMDTKPNNVVVINATIYVERESQKAILIGRGGRMLKEIGRLAREEIESLLGVKVYLELWVKVKPRWREKEGALQEFGLGKDL